MLAIWTTLDGNLGAMWYLLRAQQSAADGWAHGELRGREQLANSGDLTTSSESDTLSTLQTFMM